MASILSRETRMLELRGGQNQNCLMMSLHHSSHDCNKLSVRIVSRQVVTTLIGCIKFVPFDSIRLI